MREIVMKYFKKAFAVVAASLMLLTCLASCSKKEADTKEKKIYEGTYQEKIDAFYLDHQATSAGLMVGVFDKDGTIYEGYYGYSDTASFTPVDENTVIDWGSSTKTMVWVSVMQLWEQGKIDLEKDVREYLPDGFLTNLRYDKPVRMIDLMNHRAGFQEYYTDMFIQTQFDYYSLEEALQMDQPAQIFEPDTVTAYSNWGVGLAGYIVERISGKSFVDYVHENIFEPLGMHDSALAPDLMDNPSVRKRRDQLMCYSGTVPAGNAFYYISLYPAGACVSTLKDYIKYASCFVKDECPLFEDPDTFDVMMSATSFYGDTGIVKNSHGFWALPYGSNTFGHGGNTQACSSYITFDPERQIGAVVMTNQAGEGIFNGEMFELIYGENQWSSAADVNAKKGFYHPARTVLEGHFKIMGASYVTDDVLDEWTWTYNEKDGIPKIEYPYGDYYYAPTGSALLEVILVYGWAISLVFASVGLLVKFIRLIVRKARKSTKKTMLGKTTGFMSVLELVLGLTGLFLMIMFSIWLPHNFYMWVFPAIGILTMALIVLTVYAIVTLFRTPAKSSSVIRKIYNIAAIAFAVLNIVFVVYMQLWH